MINIFVNTVVAQNRNQLPFIGYQLAKYDSPVLVRQNEYKAYYKFYEEHRQGRVIIDEKSKTFSIKWLDGEDWIAKFSNKATRFDKEELYGTVLKITYSGKWIDDNIECALVITKIDESNCIITLKTVKVIDEDYSIDAWKKIFTFETGGECFPTIAIETIPTKKQNEIQKTKGKALFKGNKNNALVQGSKLGDPLVSNSAVEKGRAEKVKEIEIKSMIYDLEKFAPEKYLASYNIQRDAIVSYFIRIYNNSTENFPSFKSLINSKLHMQRFRNTYNIKYRLKDNSRESVIRGNIVIAGTRDITTLKEIELVSGNDSDLSLFKSASISIPTIKIEGHEVMTEAKFNNVLVDFTRGLTEVKIKKNEVEFKKYPPEKDFQELLINELKTKGVNGKYLVKYEIQDIMGQSGVNIELEKK